MFGLIPFRTNKNNGVNETNLSVNDFFNGFINDFFNDDFFAPAQFESNTFNADIKETENEYLVCAELPGVRKEDINLDFKDNYLTISAKRDEFHDESRDSYIRKERMYGQFARQIYIPNVDRSKICAKFENGELKIILPKENPTVQSESRIFIQ